MHPKWIAVIVFWAAVIIAVALPSSKTGDLVWLSIVAVAIIWKTCAVAVLAIKNWNRPGPLGPVEKAMYDGRGYPQWFQSFVGDDYARRRY